MNNKDYDGPMNYFKKLHRIYDLKKVKREGYVLDRKESSAEHTWSAMFLAEHFIQKHDLSLDSLKVLKLLLYHDLVEIESGDKYITTSEEEIIQKGIEQQALKKLKEELPEDVYDELLLNYNEFTDNTTQEARFCNAIDKIDPLFHMLRDDNAWMELNLDKETIQERKLPFIKDYPYIVELFNNILETAKSKGLLISNRKKYWDDFWKRSNSWGKPREKIIALVDSILKDYKVEKIADVGAGNGRYALEIAKRGIPTDCYDYSEEGLKIIQETTHTLGLPIRTFKTDITLLSRLVDEYDIIICSGLLEEVSPKHQEKVFRLVLNSLKPGGFAIMRYLVKSENSTLIPGVYYVEKGSLLKLVDITKFEILESREEGNIVEDKHPLVMNGLDVVHYHEVGDLVVRKIWN